MAFDKFLIAPIGDGVRRDTKPWLIPDEAFEQLNNAYNFRGRIKRRVGGKPVIDTNDTNTTRLRIKIGTTDGAGTIAPGVVPKGGSGIGAVGQMFSIGIDTFTVVDATAGAQDMLSASTTATTYTFNVATGAYDIQTSQALTDVYFYPALPVMGITQYEKIEINDEDTYAFDTSFSYRLFSTGWDRIDTGALAEWTGSDSDFFWSTNYRGLNDYTYLMFATNYTAADGMRYYDGTNWLAFSPQYASNALEKIISCRLIVSFQNRLLLFNTVEQDSTPATNTITNRCRYSVIGSPLAADAWREDIDGRGSFIDAPTREAIVSAAIIKNRLIVFFERSTYELVYTNNQVYPFIWQQINSQLGCESTFSVVPFDKAVLGIGQTGIHACNGAEVERIDNKIPDEVFEIHNDDDAVFRVHGIRDFYTELIYWAIPKNVRNNKFPSRLLVYNYKTNTWAFFDDNVTSFGYYQGASAETWQEVNDVWESRSDEWDDGNLESKFRNVIAGNQQGFTFIMDASMANNSPAQQITDISESSGIITVTSINNNLSAGDFILIENCDGFTELNGQVFRVSPNAVSLNEFTLDDPPYTVTGTYAGEGTIELVSNVEILTKRFNFYNKNGSNVNIGKTDFLIDKVDGGLFTIDYLVSSSDQSMRDAGLPVIPGDPQGSGTGAIVGDGTLVMSKFNDMEDDQERFWHAVYLQAQGETVQLKLYWTYAQMIDWDDVGTLYPFKPFEIHAILFHASSTQEL